MEDLKTHHRHRFASTSEKNQYVREQLEKYLVTLTTSKYQPGEVVTPIANEIRLILANSSTGTGLDKVPNVAWTLMASARNFAFMRTRTSAAGELAESIAFDLLAIAECYPARSPVGAYKEERREYKLSFVN